MKLIPANDAPYGDKADWLCNADYPHTRINRTAQVCDSAQVYDSAMVCGSAMVCDLARVYDSAMVCDSARVRDSAQVYDSAQVCDSAQVYDSAMVCGSARVRDSAQVCGSAQVYGSARVYGSAQVCGDGSLSKTDDWITLGPVGRESSTLTLHRDLKVGVRINRGCFSGSLAEFMEKLTETPAHAFYKAIVPLMHAELMRRMTPLDQPEPQQESNDETNTGK